MIQRMSKYFWVIFLGLFFLGITSDRLNLPWWLLNEDNGVVQSQFARMHRVRGLEYTGGLFTYETNSYPLYSNEKIHYLHSPPLMSWVYAGTTAVFGDSRVVMRGTAIFISLFLFVVFVSLIEGLEVPFFQRQLIYTFFVLSPMFLYFSRNTTSDSFGLLFLLGGCREIYVAKKRRFHSFLYGFLGGLSTFYAFVPACVFLGHSAWKKKKIEKLTRSWGMYWVGVCSGFGVLVILGILAVGFGQFIGDLVDALLRRTAIGSSEVHEHFTALGWLAQMLKWNVREFTPVNLIMTVVAVLTVFLRRGKLKAVEEIGILLTLSGLTYIVVLREGAYVHRYFQFFLIPGYSILAGIGMTEILKWMAKKKWFGKKGLDFLFFQKSTVAVCFLVLFLFCQPVLRLRYERDGRYPTENVLIHPKFLSNYSNRIWGGPLFTPIQWRFPAEVAETVRAHCQFWPDSPGCDLFQVSALEP